METPQQNYLGIRRKIAFWYWIQRNKMTSSFDAYDLMSRSLLSSIMGLKRKGRIHHSPDNSSSGLISSASSLHRSLQHVGEIEKTPHDIYREIVVECAQIERTVTSNTMAEFDSTSTSPNMLPTLSLPLANLSHPIRSFINNAQQQSHSLMVTDAHSTGGTVEANSPPPYSLLPPVLTGNDAPTFMKESHLSTAEPSMMMLSVKREDGVDAISVDELVKLVVLAMKNSALSEVEKESPEAILRRKRQQNNKAAARYRKRQREAKNVVESEMDRLLRRNESLRQTVERMQLEIAELKRAVLNGNTS